MQATGLSAKETVVEEGLRLLIRMKGQEGLRRLRGKIVFERGVVHPEKGEVLQ